MHDDCQQTSECLSGLRESSFLQHGAVIKEENISRVI